jgi:hypothetical protein
MAEAPEKPSSVTRAGEMEKNLPREDASQARRSVIKAGLIGVPLILTLKSRSAFAQDRTLSAQSSMTPSSLAPGTTAGQ